MGIRLMELKIDTEYFGELERHDYIVKESVQEVIVNWECLAFMSGMESVKEYMKKHPFPKDGRYSKQEFLNDIEGAAGYIHLAVENTETAEYIQELIYELI